MCWYELIVNGHKEIDTKKLIFGQMSRLKEQVESNLEKRFVYFICSRKKVRFCKDTTPSLISDGNKLKLALRIGKERQLREILVDALYEESGLVASVDIEQTGRFISFGHSTGKKLIFSIHDFLLEFGVNLGIDTVVQYVGYTKNPNSRPLNGVHGGLSDVLYKVSNEDNDILFFFNLFKVITSAENSEFNIHFSVANSMTDEVKVDQEGFVIEKCFIFYFDSKNQTKNKAKEKGEIENNLLAFAQDHKIGSVAIHFEVDDESEYYKFSSSKIEAKHQHVFTTKLKNGQLVTKEGADLFEKNVKPWV
jgi:hypothetical protein